MKRFFIAMDVFVTGEEVAAVGGVGTGGAGVALGTISCGVGLWRSALCDHDRGWARNASSAADSSFVTRAVHLIIKNSFVIQR